MYDQKKARSIIKKQENVEVIIFQGVSWMQLLVPVVLILLNILLLFNVCISFEKGFANLDFWDFFPMGLASSLINMFVPYVLYKAHMNESTGDVARKDGHFAITYYLYAALGMESNRYTRSERNMIVFMLFISTVIQVYLIYLTFTYTGMSGHIQVSINLLLRVAFSICLDFIAGYYAVSMLQKFGRLAKEEVKGKPEHKRPEGDDAGEEDNEDDDDEDNEDDDGDDKEKKPMAGGKIRNLPAIVTRDHLQKMMKTQRN